jgi:hypothetical protein
LDDNGNEDFKSTQGDARPWFFVARTDAGAQRWLVPTLNIKGFV